LFLVAPIPALAPIAIISFPVMLPDSAPLPIPIKLKFEFKLIWTLLMDGRFVIPLLFILRAAVGATLHQPLSETAPGTAQYAAVAPAQIVRTLPTGCVPVGHVRLFNDVTVVPPRVVVPGLLNVLFMFNGTFVSRRRPRVVPEM
jgi:hypothetical protein